MDILWIISFILFVISFLGIIFAARFFTEKIDEYNFSFKRIFPFEVSRNSGKYSKLYNSLVYLFCLMCFAPIFIIMNLETSVSQLNGMTYFCACVFVLASIVFVFMHMYDVTHVKVHLILFVAFCALTMLGNTLVVIRGATCFSLFEKHGSTEPLFIICEILSGLALVLTMLVIINPKLKTWAVLDKVEGEKEAYVRPKKFPLAYSEWAIFLALFVGELSLFLELYIK